MKTDVVSLLLRIAVGGMMFLHGVSKMKHGVAGIGGSLKAKGLIASFAYGVYVGEVVAPVLMVLGVWTRPAAWIVAFNMLVAIWLAHAGDVTRLSRGGGWAIELQAFYLVGAVGVALLGAGRYSFSRGAGRFD